MESLDPSGRVQNSSLTQNLKTPAHTFDPDAPEELGATSEKRETLDIKTEKSERSPYIILSFSLNCFLDLLFLRHKNLN